MVESVSRMKFGIDPFTVLDKFIERYGVELPDIVNISYDKEADVLYFKFNLTTKAVDNDSLDDNGLILVGTDNRGEITALTVIDASSLLEIH